MEYVNLDDLKKEIAKASLSNEDITRFGDGFEKAITLINEVVSKLPIHNVSNRYTDDELKEFTVEMVKQITGKDVTNEYVAQGDADAQICFYYLKEVNNGC